METLTFEEVQNFYPVCLNLYYHPVSPMPITKVQLQIRVGTDNNSGINSLISKKKKGML